MAPRPSAAKNEARIAGRAARLRHQQRVVRPGVQLQHFAVVGAVVLINVRRQHVEGRGGGLPDAKYVVSRPAAFVRAGGPGVNRIAQRGIGIHRQGIFLLAGGRHLPHEARDGPGVKVLVGVGAEYRRPVAAGGGGHAEGLEQFAGHGPGEDFLGRRGIVAHAAPGARFVLHLHHDYGAFGVGLLEVAHEGAEGAHIALQRGRRMR